ncbi:hypothetical protein PPSIR1_40190 [Plesiocystis pacifica SIR-1]|uniref:Uncharacterized protein n=2 Tax=Plesiocystis pacifica TaxID=191768 RepID=A6FYG8_9BACT|nr:hypothetical protein PPSIR1_40190 [Plesiocystis pacifica SIR-1]
MACLGALFVCQLGCAPVEGGGSSEGEELGADSTAGEDEQGEQDSSWLETDEGETEGSEEIELANVEGPCTNSDSLTATEPTEDQSYLAVALTPPAFPFEVTRVRYRLLGEDMNPDCNSQQAHTMMVFVRDEQGMPASPSMAEPMEFHAVEADPNSLSGRDVAIELDAPIVLEEGEAIVVAVELKTLPDLSDKICVRACADGPWPLETNYWSGESTEPYAWADTVADYDLQWNMVMMAYGAAL